MGFGALAKYSWGSGFHWFVWNAFGMLGLWGGGLLVFYIFLKNPPWLELVDRGQFLLYSVGFLAPAMYLLVKERQITTIPFRTPLIFFWVVDLFVCGLLYSGTILGTFTESPDVVPRLSILRYLGAATLVTSMIIGFLVVVATEAREDVDLTDLRDEGLRRLDRDFPDNGGNVP